MKINYFLFLFYVIFFNLIVILAQTFDNSTIHVAKKIKQIVTIGLVYQVIFIY